MQTQRKEPRGLFSRRRLLAMLPALPAAKLLIAQQNPQTAPASASQPTLRTAPESPSPTFSTDVKVVNVFATVRDKDGHIVSNLSKDDFVLQEDGRPQTIRYFSREVDLPLTLGLLVDTSMSQRRVLGDERTASYSFFEHVLREDKDQAFVIHFDHEVELLQDLTSSRQKLEKALRELDVSQDQSQQGSGRGGGGGGGYPGGGGGYPGGGRRGGGASGHHAGTLLYDSVLLASDELMKKQKGRKAVVVLSDGVDRGSKVSIMEAIEHAQRADTLVYSILFADHEGFGGGPGFGGMGRRGGGMPRNTEERPDGKKVLQRISRETGGTFFEVSKKQPIDKIYERVQEELRNQYSLGYTSDQPNSGTDYRRISLIANQKSLIVQTREGYYPISTGNER
ncbi:MAG: VWA domain-containing protein [Bryobacteraceae bacterium]